MAASIQQERAIARGGRQYYGLIPAEETPYPGRASMRRNATTRQRKNTQASTSAAPSCSRLRLAGDDVVVFDFPLTVRPARMLSDKFPVEYDAHGAHRRRPPRTGATTWAAVNRASSSTRRTRTLRRRARCEALRSLPATPSSFIASYTPAFLYEWRTRGGRCLSENIFDTAAEFPAVDPLRRRGRAVLLCDLAATIGAQHLRPA